MELAQVAVLPRCNAPRPIDAPPARNTQRARTAKKKGLSLPWFRASRPLPQHSTPKMGFQAHHNLGSRSSCQPETDVACKPLIARWSGTMAGPDH